MTGRHGFVGGVLAHLISTDPVLHGWQLMDTPETWDLRDSAVTAAIVADTAPDAVVHLAAQ
ncbi:MAG TPA: NAD-dependent epimerase/dehydratase family protein, partial [Casimicrobiaceae bacterium]|nr:NAD-dependent epimerase/dehydratase family protein [Casimicrobiaceae bacterium]